MLGVRNHPSTYRGVVTSAAPIVWPFSTESEVMGHITIMPEPGVYPYPRIRQAGVLDVPFQNAPSSTGLMTIASLNTLDGS